MDFFQWLGTAIGGGTALGVANAVGRFILSRRKQNDAWATAQFNRLDAANVRYREELEKRLTGMGEKLQECERAHKECEAHNRALDAELAIVKTALGMLQGEGQLALIEADEEGLITNWNHVATALFQWSRAEAVGKPVTILIPHKLRRRHGVAFARRVTHDKQAMTDGQYLVDQQSIVLETVAMRRDGQEVPVTVSISSWEHKGKCVLAAEITKN